jgi:hypothetical protein
MVRARVTDVQQHGSTARAEFPAPLSTRATPPTLRYR